MAKISKEEYEKIKGLDDQWKWIARDKNTTLWAYEDKPIKQADGWDEYSGGCEMVESDLFQFIQWEDEETYDIQELIEEYESEKLVKEDADMELCQENHDLVHRPHHYNQGNIETLDIIKEITLGYDGFEASLVGNVVKYLDRAPFKGKKMEDLQKAQVYLNRLVEEVQDNDKSLCGSRY